MASRKSNLNSKQEKSDTSIKVAIISTIGVIATALITALIGPAVIRLMDRTPTPMLPSQTVIPSPTPQSRVFVDNFETGYKDWNINCSGSDGYYTASCSIVDQAFRWQVVGEKISTAYMGSTLPSVDDFDLEITLKLVQHSPEAWYGVVFRNNAAGKYNFLINNDGQFLFNKGIITDNGRSYTYTNLVKPKKEPAINLSSENKLRIKAKGNRIDLYINDKLVNSMPDDSFSFGTIDIIASMAKDQTLTLDLINSKLIVLPPP
jgi:hypothetical protein